ncbi:MAG: cell division protein ZapA [Cypionkella sp.]
MSEVALRIGGRTFRVACAPGEEERIVKLGTVIADKLAALGNPGGPDAPNLLFAALLLADEVHELRVVWYSSRTCTPSLASIAWCRPSL